MKKITVLIGLVLITSFLLSGTASAAPAGQATTFQFDGVFSTTEKPIDAGLEFTGRADVWGPKPWMGRLSGTLVMDKGGPDEKERNLWVKPEGDVGVKHYDDGFGECMDGIYELDVPYPHGEDRWTIISVGANELHGTGELWWGWGQVCVNGDLDEDFGYGGMRAVLVGGQTAGLFRELTGPEPYVEF